ncbi:hypothetical protein AMTR_s00172p00029050 [Amborella trichopoda]|uniref:Uncharacterized protein n=1 Tax=Amborella trichopoda TaxID=13333 RepID=W1PXU9_AMBTC|nr:hypothetical protein AMTR_s00172p00029050 [Amborella trichopoda]
MHRLILNRHIQVLPTQKVPFLAKWHCPKSNQRLYRGAILSLRLLLERKNNGRIRGKLDVDNLHGELTDNPIAVSRLKAGKRGPETEDCHYWLCKPLNFAFASATSKSQSLARA